MRQASPHRAGHGARGTPEARQPRPLAPTKSVGGLGSQRPARGRRDGTFDSPGGGWLPARPRPVPLTAAGIGVSSAARRRPETRPLRPLAATKLPDGTGSQRPARRRLVRTGDSLAGGWSPATAARSGRWSASGAVRRVGTAGNRAPGTSAPSEGLKRTGQPAAGTMPAWRDNPPRGRWPLDQRPPHDLSAVAAAPRAGAEGRMRRFKLGLNSRSEQGSVLFFRRLADLGARKSPSKSAGWQTELGGLTGRPPSPHVGVARPLEILARGQRQPRRAAAGARSDEKSALTHFLDWITTWAWTWNYCDRMCEKAA